MIRKIAIANRGEIALRLLSACEEMGLDSVLLYSSADKNSLACRRAKDKICIGAGDPIDSYLNIPAVIEGALSAGAEALHPGYGFLSENAELAEACANKDLVFIGPSAECLKLFGNKVSARKQAKRCGLPIVPGFSSPDPYQLLQSARQIGFPIMIKAVKGGGGRGLRVVHSEKEWQTAIDSAIRESQKAFNTDELFIEKYLPSAKHIEVQIFADSAGQVHYLFDRDCSIQRKHQKIIESAPVDTIPLTDRQSMAKASVKILKSVNYRQAGTVEFLYHNKQFYFMEVNPRLQVECPVTEQILGINLIKAQILTAQGFSAFTTKSALTPRGHSIQCRIYAEDIQKGLPLSGQLGSCYFPHGPGRRFDMGYETKDHIPGFYDSMLGKIIVWAEDRISAIERMKWTLKHTVIFGIKTNINFLLDLMEQEKFISGEASTRFVEKEFLPLWKEPDSNLLDPQLIFTLRQNFSKSVSDNKQHPHTPDKTFNPWKET